MALRVREFSVVAEMLLFSGQYLDIVPGAKLNSHEEYMGSALLFNSKAIYCDPEGCEFQSEDSVGRFGEGCQGQC